MALAALLLLQTLATALAAAYFWRQHNRLRSELNALRESVTALQTNAALAQRAAQKRAEPGSVTGLPTAIVAPAEAPLDRARKRWRLPTQTPSSNEPLAAAVRGALLAVAGAAPAFCLFFGIGADIAISSALFIAAALLLTGLRPGWELAAPASLAFALIWCGLAWALGSDGIVIAAPLAALGFTGLAHARLGSDWIGAAVAGAAVCTALALAWQTTFIGAPGLSFALVVVGAAIVGASSLRLDALLIGAFGMSLLGLFAMSGHESAAIWFTPVVALHGALFLAIAAVRAPQLGARGALIAGLAMLSVLGAAVALNVSQHGLANDIAAAGVFAAAAAAFAGIIALAATRRDRGLAALKLTLWILALAVFVGLACATALAAPAPTAAVATALTALAAIALDRRYPSAAWRAGAVGGLALTLVHAYAAAQLLLGEAPHWSAFILLALGIGLPGVIAGATAYVSHQTKAVFTASVAEATALLLCVASANLMLRTIFSNGAMLLTPIGFVEAGAHATIWLLVALACAARAQRGASTTRMIAAHFLGVGALVAMGVSGALWMSDHWTDRASGVAGVLSYAPLGFLMPALAAGAHWIFWRARDSELQARVAFGAGAFTAAGFATLAVLGMELLSETARALICALVIAAAIAMNFAPGVAAPSDRAKPTLRRRRRRRQLPQQA
jgi:hypothetical protein